MNEIVDELVEYCTKDYHSGALLLTGGWGCGKTYFIEHVLREKLEENYILIRISLFGIDSVNTLNSLIKNKWIYRYLQEYNIIHEADEEFISKAKRFGKSFQRLIPKRYKWIFMAASSAIDMGDLLEIKKKIKDKEVIYVFDDLERSNVDMDQLLGCINEVCENKNIKVILIANEEKVEEKDYYREFKEKIVERTIYYDLKSAADLISNIVKDLIKEEQDLDYKNLIKKNTDDITKLFINAKDLKEDEYEKKIVAGNLQNIRSLKCGIRDFKRVFRKLRDVGFKEYDHWLFDFLCFFLFARATNLKNGEYGTILEEGAIKEKYIGYYDGRYITNGVKSWIMYGHWDVNEITNGLEEKLKQMSAETPEERVQRRDLLSLKDEDLLYFPTLLEKAYNGQIDLDDYVNIITNSYLSRNYGIPIPVINWDKFYEGIQIRINHIKNKSVQYHENRGYVRKDINKKNKNEFTDEEWRAYEMIDDFENKRSNYDDEKFYVELLSKDPMDAFKKLNGMTFESFNQDMCNVTYNVFISLENMDKGAFISYFENIWDQQLQSSQFNVHASIEAFVKLRDMLIKYLEQAEHEGHVICCYHVKRFVDSVNKLINKINAVA